MLVDGKIVSIERPVFVVVVVGVPYTGVATVLVLWAVPVVVDTVVVVLVDDKIICIRGPGFVVVVGVPYTGDTVVLILWDVPVVDDTVVVVLANGKIASPGEPGFVVVVNVAYA